MHSALGTEKAPVKVRSVVNFSARSLEFWGARYMYVCMWYVHMYRGFEGLFTREAFDELRTHSWAGHITNMSGDSMDSALEESAWMSLCFRGVFLRAEKKIDERQALLMYAINWALFSGVVFERRI